jgi:DNA-binding transcriptional regulator YbjK
MAIDLTVGLTFILHPLGLDRKAAAGLLTGQRDPEPLLAKLARQRGTTPAPDDHRPTRFAETRQRIVDAAIQIIIDEGATALSYGRVAKAADMVRSGPLYYFRTIDALLEAAQTALFERAKARYRQGLSSSQMTGMDETRLLDLTTAIFYREAFEFGRENVGHYSVWMRAAQNPALRPAVAASLLDLHRAWMRRIASVSGSAVGPQVAIRIQALFIGKLIRAIAASVEVGDLSRARNDFAAVIAR